MDRLFELVANFLGAASALGAIFYFFGDRLLRSLVQRNLQEQKHDLDLTLAEAKSRLSCLAFERQTVFSKLHERRAGLLEEAYKQLLDVKSRADKFATGALNANPNDADPPLKQFDQISAEFRSFIDKNRLWFSPDICDAFEKWEHEVTGAVTLSDAWRKRPLDHPNRNEGLVESWVKVSAAGKTQLQTLENEFRQLLGVTTSTQERPMVTITPPQVDMKRGCFRLWTVILITSLFASMVFAYYGTASACSQIYKDEVQAKFASLYARLHKARETPLKFDWPNCQKGLHVLSGLSDTDVEIFLNKEKTAIRANALDKDSDFAPAANFSIEEWGSAVYTAGLWCGDDENSAIAEDALKKAAQEPTLSEFARECSLSQHAAMLLTMRGMSYPLAAVILSLLLLVLGKGIAWTVEGFRKEG